MKQEKPLLWYSKSKYPMYNVSIRVCDVEYCVRMRRTSAHSCVLCCHWSRQSQAAALWRGLRHGHQFSLGRPNTITGMRIPRLEHVRTSAEMTRTKEAAKGNSVIATKLIPGRGNEVCIKCIVDLSFQYYCTKCLSRLKETLQSPIPRRCWLICWRKPVQLCYQYHYCPQSQSTHLVFQYPRRKLLPEELRSMLTLT